MTGLRATAGSTCASRASGGHGGRCHAGVPHARCVEDARERARRLERVDYVLAEMWIVWWCALAVERLVWDCWLRHVGAANACARAQSCAASEAPGIELGVRSTRISGAIPVRRKR